MANTVNPVGAAKITVIRDSSTQPATNKIDRGSNGGDSNGTNSTSQGEPKAGVPNRT